MTTLSEPPSLMQGAPPTRGTGPHRLRRWLERRGPVGIKLGQFLALRPDLLPQEYCDELLRLTDEVAFFPWEDARQIIRADLGDEPERLFAWIDKRPLAAGSLAQVHVARTHEGDEVVVKVQRLGVHEAIRRDLERAKWLVRFLRVSGILRAMSPDALLREFSSWLDRELDFQRELNNVERLGQLNLHRPVRIPRAFRDLSQGRVLTVQRVRGVPFSELLRGSSDERARRMQSLGIDPVRLATNLHAAVLAQMFDDQFFHADIHPGNLIALSDDLIGFVDFGLVEPLDNTFRQGMSGYLEAVYSGDAERMFRSLQELLTRGPRADLDGFHQAFIMRTRSWMRERFEADMGDREGRSPLARYMVVTLESARHHDLRVPPGILAMYRTLLTAEVISTELRAGDTLAHVARDFFSRRRLRETLSALDLDQLFLFASNVIAYLRDAPVAVNRILTDLADDRFALRVHTAESGEDRLYSNTRARLIAVAVASIGISVLLGAGELAERGWSLWETRALWVALAGCYVGIALLWRRLS